MVNLNRTITRLIFLVMVLFLTSCVQSADEYKSNPIQETWVGHELTITFQDNNVVEVNGEKLTYLIDNRWLFIYSGNELKIYGTYTLYGRELSIYQYYSHALYLVKSE